MKKLLLLAALLGAWHWYVTSERRAPRPDAEHRVSQRSAIAPSETRQRFVCDGRTHCSHMRSCEEATYFLRHCPNTKMDGDGDGIPCERQWCGH